MEILSKATQDTKKLAGEIADKVHGGRVIALYGDLGAGKTTFVRYFVEALGIDARVQSPTFVLVREYTSDSSETRVHKVYHVDLYRLKSKEDLEDLNLEELFEDPGSVTLIEWPELAESILPEDTVKISFTALPGEGNEEKRKIHVQNLY